MVIIEKEVKETEPKKEKVKTEAQLQKEREDMISVVMELV